MEEERGRIFLRKPEGPRCICCHCVACFSQDHPKKKGFHVAPPINVPGFSRCGREPLPLKFCLVGIVFLAQFAGQESGVEKSLVPWPA